MPKDACSDFSKRWRKRQTSAAVLKVFMILEEGHIPQLR